MDEIVETLSYSGATGHVSCGISAPGNHALVVAVDDGRSCCKACRSAGRLISGVGGRSVPVTVKATIKMKSTTTNPFSQAGLAATRRCSGSIISPEKHSSLVD